MYGPGIYATYKLTSQLNAYMSRYGEYLVKCRVSLQGYIILDSAEAKKVYKEKYALRDQLSQYYSLKWLDEESTWLFTYEKTLRDHPGEKTSPIASDLYEHYQIDKVAPGLLFTGGHDDAVVVTYKPEYIIPIEYAHHPVGTGTAVVWTPLDLSNYKSHLRKVGTFIRTPPAEKSGSSEFSKVYQTLADLADLDQKEIAERVSKISSLSIEYTGIAYAPVLRGLQEPLVKLVQQKFHSPESEFLALVKPLLDKRFNSGIAESCAYLQKIFSYASVQCQRRKTNAIKITLTFPSTRSVLLFIQYMVRNKDRFSIETIIDFLHSDTPATRKAMLKTVISVLTDTELLSFFLPFRTTFLDYLDRVKAAPSTK
jgi:hypothetical protein